MAASNGLKRRELSYSAFLKIYSAADICDAHVGCHELLGQSYLIPQVCPIRILSKSLVHSRSTRHLKTPFAIYICLLFRCPVSPWSQYYSLSWASVRKQVKLYESLSFTLVREHRFLGSVTSIWPRLMASNAANWHISNVAKSILQRISVMRTWDVMSF